MKKIWNGVKKWSFLFIWGLCGLIFLSYFDTQNVYGGVLEKWTGLYGHRNGEESDIAGKNGPVEKRTGEKDSGNAVNAGEIENQGSEEGNAGEEKDYANAKPQDSPENETVPGEGAVEYSSKEGEKTERQAFQGYQSVEDDYFADAVFIGDSRTVGLSEYGGLEEVSTFYASIGLTIYKIFDEKIASLEGQKGKVTIREALEQVKFKKVYLMIGINEMGTGTVDTFIEKYREVVEEIRALEPDAIIYIQAIMKVTTERSNKGDYITNEGIDERNERLEEMADNVTLFYLDVNPAVCDETGGMREDYTYDGVHLKGKHVLIWKDFLKEHAVITD